MNGIRRRAWLGAVAVAALGRWPGAAHAATLPAGLADLVWPGATLAQEHDPANTANKTYRLAGRLGSGATEVQAFQGTQLFDLRLPGDAGDSQAGRQRIVSVLKHYDTAVARAGGRRLNQGFDATAWTDVNARLHLYSRPSETGEVAFGLWIQDAGMTHWLLLLPATDPRAAPQAPTLAERIRTLGHAPVYLHFDTLQSALPPQAGPVVQQIVALLKEAPDWSLAIEGHTDDVGQPTDNLKLSQARAEAVMQAVVAQGIDARRLRAVGRGATQPVASNRSPAGRALNRRVELVHPGGS